MNLNESKTNRLKFLKNELNVTERKIKIFQEEKNKIEREIYQIKQDIKISPKKTITGKPNSDIYKLEIKCKDGDYNITSENKENVFIFILNKQDVINIFENIDFYDLDELKEWIDPCSNNKLIGYINFNS